MGHAPKKTSLPRRQLGGAAAKISFETFGSATILEIVSAPSIVARNTLADFFGRSVPGSFIRSATSAIILRIPLGGLGPCRLVRPRELLSERG